MACHPFAGSGRAECEQSGDGDSVAGVSRQGRVAPAVRARLEKLAGRRVSTEGALLIEANRFRSQERNRADAWERFEALLTKALVKPKPRIATRVSNGQRRQRVDDKTKRGATKRLRRTTGAEE